MMRFRRLTGWVLMGAAAMASSGCLIVDIDDGGETIHIRRSIVDDIEWEFDLLKSSSHDDGGRSIEILNIGPVEVVDVDQHPDSLSVEILDISPYAELYTQRSDAESLDLNFVHTHLGGDLVSVYQRHRDGSDAWWTLADVDLFGNDMVALIEARTSEDSSEYEIGDLEFFDTHIATVLETSSSPEGNEFALADVSIYWLAGATLLDCEVDEEGFEFDLIETELFDSDLANLLSVEMSPEQSEFTFVELGILDIELFEGISAEAGEDFHEFTLVEALWVTLFECETEGEELEWALVDADLPYVPFGLMDYESDGGGEVEFGFLRLPFIGTLFRYEADADGTRIRSLFGSRVSW